MKLKLPLLSLNYFLAFASLTALGGPSRGRFDGRDFILDGESPAVTRNLSLGLAAFGTVEEGDSLAEISNRMHRESRWHFQDGVGLMSELRSQRLIVREDSKNLRVRQSQRIGVGSGYGLGLNLLPIGLPTGVIPFVGVIPIVGATKTTERLAPDLSTAQSSPDLAIPQRADEVARWRTGDQMSLAANGGLLTLAGASAFGVFAGGTLLIQGEWTLDLRKMQNDVVLIRWTRDQVRSTGLIQGIAVIAVSEQAMQATSTSYTYLLNLARPEARRAFEAAVRGQIVWVQELAAQNERAALSVGDRSDKLRGRLYSFGFSLPFLRWTTGRTRLFSQGIERRFQDGTQIAGQQGVTLWSTENSFFGNYRHLDQAFFVRDWKETTPGTDSFDTTLAAYRMSFQKNKARRRDLEGALETVAQRTGLTVETRMNIADLPEELGDLDVQFQLEWGPRAFAALERSFASAQSRANARQVANDFAESYFRRLTQRRVLNNPPGGLRPTAPAVPSYEILGDVLKVCEGVNGLETCRAVRLEGIQDSLVKIEKLAAKARVAREEGRRSDVIAALSEIGRDLVVNPFVFQAYHRLLQKSESADLRSRLDVRGGLVDRQQLGY